MSRVRPAKSDGRRDFIPLRRMVEPMRGRSLAAGLVLVASACGSSSDVGTVADADTVATDGVLDCRQGEVVRDAGVRVSGGSEKAVVAAALKRWTDQGGSLGEFPSEESWSVVVLGREVAVAIPEREGSGDWVVHDVRMCGNPRTGSSVINGKLDCESDVEFSVQGSVLPDAQGPPTPAAALESFLAELVSRYGGEMAIVDDATGSLVVEGRETVVAFATPAPAGGWIVLTALHCEKYGI